MLQKSTYPTSGTSTTRLPFLGYQLNISISDHCGVCTATLPHDLTGILAWRGLLPSEPDRRRPRSHFFPFLYCDAQWFSSNCRTWYPAKFSSRQLSFDLISRFSFWNGIHLYVRVFTATCWCTNEICPFRLSEFTAWITVQKGTIHVWQRRLGWTNKIFILNFLTLWCNFCYQVI